MQDQLKSIAVDWSDEAQELLSAAVPNGNILDIKNQVDQGASLFKLSHGDKLIGYYVLRIDRLAQHNEAVIVAAVGVHDFIDLTMTICPVIETQINNCSFIRIHTARPGLVKKLALIGYQPQEFVMRKALNV